MVFSSSALTCTNVGTSLLSSLTHLPQEHLSIKGDPKLESRKTKDIGSFYSSTRTASARSYYISNYHRKQITASFPVFTEGGRCRIQLNSIKEMFINKNKHEKIQKAQRLILSWVAFLESHGLQNHHASEMRSHWNNTCIYGIWGAWFSP